MRLFVSINLPESLERVLREAQGYLVDFVGGDGRRVDLALAGRKSGFHLTLFFLGEVSVDMAMKLQKELGAVSFNPFKLRFKDRLGFFKRGGGRSRAGSGGGSGEAGGAGGFIKAIFVDVDSECEGFSELLDLQKKVVEVVGKFGFKEERVFVPHITLARVGFCPAEYVADFERKILGIEVSNQEFEVGAFYLMESCLGAGGSVYEEVGRFLGSIKS